MKAGQRSGFVTLKVLMLFAILAMIPSSSGQVNPVESQGSKAKIDEQVYLPKLQMLHEAIQAADFQYPFQLARYPTAESGRAAKDDNGIEFVSFQNRIVLKVSGIYHVTFDANSLTENMRVEHTLRGAIIPLMRMVEASIPPNSDCDGVGFEIVYGTRDHSKAYDFQGREALAIIFGTSDAQLFLNARDDEERQVILSRSDVFVNGKPFPLALGQSDPLERGSFTKPKSLSEPQVVPVTASSPLYPGQSQLAMAGSESTTLPRIPAESPSKTGKSASLEAKFRPRLTTLAFDEGARLNLVGGIEPSFEDDRDQVLLHFTLREPLSFNGSSASIYKKAAQSFDLFLATELKELLKNIPQDAQFDGFKFSVLGHNGPETTTSEEIVYVCPLSSTRLFVEDRITSQDLINQSVVIVNGVRIGLNLAAVE